MYIVVHVWFEFWPNQYMSHSFSHCGCVLSLCASSFDRINIAGIRSHNFAVCRLCHLWLEFRPDQSQLELAPVGIAVFESKNEVEKLKVFGSRSSAESEVT